GLAEHVQGRLGDHEADQHEQLEEGPEPLAAGDRRPLLLPRGPLGLVVLAGAERAGQPAPAELEEDGPSGGAGDDRLHDHAARGGIEVGQVAPARTPYASGPPQGGTARSEDSGARGRDVTVKQRTISRENQLCAGGGLGATGPWT